MNYCPCCNDRIKDGYEYKDMLVCSYKCIAKLRESEEQMETLLDKLRTLSCFPTDATIRRTIFLKGLTIDGQPIESFEDLHRPAFHCEVKVGKKWTFSI